METTGVEESCEKGRRLLAGIEERMFMLRNRNRVRIVLKIENEKKGKKK